MKRTASAMLVFIAIILSSPVFGTSQTSAAFLPSSIEIVSPADGSTHSSSFTVQTEASSPSGIFYVKFYIDGTYLGKDYSAPYTRSIDPSSYSHGSHTIKAVMYPKDHLPSIQDTIQVYFVGGPVVEGELPWWHDVVDVEAAHNAGYYGDDTVAVIIDSGLTSKNSLIPELEHMGYENLFPSGSVLTQYCRSYTKLHGYDNVDWDEDLQSGHGTKVTAMLLGYYVPQSWGVQNNFVMGVAPNAKVIHLRVTTTSSLLNDISDSLLMLRDAINYATSLKQGSFASKKMVISISLGFAISGAPPYGFSEVETAIDNAIYHGIPVSVASGNHFVECDPLDGACSPNHETVLYPANFPSSTAVGSGYHPMFTSSYDSSLITTDMSESAYMDVGIALYSNYGPGMDLVGIGTKIYLPSWNGYSVVSGTSFACPQITGAYLLLSTRYSSYSPSQLKTQLENTAVSNGDADHWGAGLIQLDSALNL